MALKLPDPYIPDALDVQDGWVSIQRNFERIVEELRASAPTGVIAAFGGSTAPVGWLLCNGQAVNRTTYADLFTAIGTTYGTGDGSTTFNVPDLRGRVAAGVDSGAGRISSNNALGNSAGTQTHTLATSETPSHNHTGNTSTDGSHQHGPGAGTYFMIANNLGADLASGANYVGPDTLFTTTTTAGSHSHSLTINSTGGGGAHNNLQPYQITNFIIRV
jgi:microcystin-dependent protein